MTEYRVTQRIHPSICTMAYGTQACERVPNENRNIHFPLVLLYHE